MRTFRRWAPLAVIPAVAIGLTAVATGSESVAPVPQIRAVTATTHLGGRRVLLLKTLRVSGIAGERLVVSCNGCQRFPGRVQITRRADYRVFRGVNWLLQPHRGVTVRVFRPGQVGRFVVLAARVSGQPGLVFQATGCLQSLATVRRCPSNTASPAPGSAVPVSATLPPLPPTTTTPTTVTTPTGPLTPTATITVLPGGRGVGTIAGTGGISCPGTCSAALPIGTSVTLAATPGTKSMFMSFGGNCSTISENVCKLVVGSNQTVAATFNILGDITGDGYVGCADKTILLNSYDTPETAQNGDLNGDGQVNITDLSILLSNWNPPPGEASC